MGALFADYRPNAPGTATSVGVTPMSRVDLDGCVALAVQREGGEEARWRTSLERSLDAKDRTTFVAVLDGHLAGYGTVGWFAPGRIDSESAIPDGWYLLGLVVDPHSWRQGVGRQLTAARLGWLTTRTRTRTRRVWYFVSSTNRASIDLHSKLGFEMIAGNIEIPGVTFTESGQLYAADLPWAKHGQLPRLAGLSINASGCPSPEARTAVYLKDGARCALAGRALPGRGSDIWKVASIT